MPDRVEYAFVGGAGGVGDAGGIECTIEPGREPGAGIADGCGLPTTAERNDAAISFRQVSIE